MSMLWLASPTMHGEEQEYIKKAFDSNWITTIGKNIDDFEKKISQYVDCKYAVGLSCGTAALHIAAKLAGIGEGDIVLCSDLTFVATANPVSYENATQVFIDSDRETWNMDPAALEIGLKKYGDKVKAVIVANLYGTPARLDEIADLCNKYNVTLIEDAAESLSATYKGRQTGTFGKYNVFSFNGNKIITTSSGGMLVTNDENAAKKARFLATQAREPRPWYQHLEIGYNYRMSNILAGVGCGQFLHLEEHHRLKRDIYYRYKEAFSGLPISMNPHLECSEPNYWLSCILIDKDCKVRPNDIYMALLANEIESRPIWKPMHLQPLYKDRDYISVGDENVCEDIFSRGLCLPSDIKMTEEQQENVVKIIKSFF